MHDRHVLTFFHNKKVGAKQHPNTTLLANICTKITLKSVQTACKTVTYLMTSHDPN